MSRIRNAAAALLLAALALPAGAAPVDYVFTGIATGALGNIGFLNRLVTVTASGDTNDVTGGAISINNNVNTSVAIAGIGSVLITGEDYVFNASFSRIVGYGVQGIPLCCDIIQLENPAYGAYDLRTSIGPLPSPTDLSIDDFVHVPTSAGVLTLVSYQTNTFTATVSAIPLPPSVVLLGSVLAGLGFTRRRLRA